jgi:hypothetical protein
MKEWVTMTVPVDRVRWCGADARGAVGVVRAGVNA